jgi:hypothetical protein
VQNAINLKTVITNAVDLFKMGQQYYWAHAPVIHNNECIP